MILERIINQLKSDEGFKANPYQDTIGVWTIGYGCTSLKGVKVDKDTARINKYNAEKALFEHLFIAWKRAQRYVKNYHELSHEKQESLVNMSYQMGKRVKGFVKAIKAIENEQWDIAHKELLNSKWAQQTPDRALRVAEKFLL